MKRTFMVMSLGIVIVLSGCASDVPKPDDGKPKPEAREWMKANKNPYGFASERFGPLSEAAKFVESLYAAGATKVLVDSVFNEPKRLQDEGGPYADALLVELPTDKDKRAALFRIHRRESRGEGFGPTQDTGQKELLFWWD